MYLGIEIGGTKTQLAVGTDNGSTPVEIVRTAVEVDHGASGILNSIDQQAHRLLQKYPIRAIGIGFGGPVDSKTGVTTTSHQINGWDQFPLKSWTENLFQKPCLIFNDCDTAALAEATFGAGKNARTVFYITVGTGVGGGFVVDQKLFGSTRPAIAEIGHLRPGLQAIHAESTVESLASGWAIAAEVRSRIAGDIAQSLTISTQVSQSDQEVKQEFIADLLARCQNNPDSLTAKIVAQAAIEGNSIAIESIKQATDALAWSIASVITLLSPELIVIGGGVSLLGESLFFQPIRQAVEQYVFPPLLGSYEIVQAHLNEEVVLYGALLLAAQVDTNQTTLEN